MSAHPNVSGSFSEGFRRSKHRLVVGAAAVLLIVGVAVAIVDPFASNQRSDNALANDAPTALQTVQRRSLTARETLTGTLGYAGVWTVAVPSATSAEALQQAEQQEAAAHAAYVTAQASLSGDEQSLTTAEAELQAARLKEISDCAGSNAAAISASPATANGVTAASTIGASPCASSMQTAEANQEAVVTARQTVLAARGQLTAARLTLGSVRGALDAARSASSAYGSVATYTMLPAPGKVVRRGQALYSINGSDTLLLYGATPAWRGLASGVSPGRDVAQLNANLRVLGFETGGGENFTGSTEQGIEALQRTRGLRVTGSLPLGSVVFEPSAARVAAVTPTVGQSVQPGQIMTLSSTRHEVSIQLDVSQQSQVKEGDRVIVTLPDNSTTPGVVASVGKVASVPSGGQGSNGNAAPGSPSIPLRVRLLRPDDAGTLDQAPINVLITTATVRNALVVPVSALVALAGGGYALEEVAGKGTHQLVPVTPGLFDDQEGLVQVRGSGVVAGQRVVVPAS